MFAKHKIALGLLVALFLQACAPATFPPSPTEAADSNPAPTAEAAADTATPKPTLGPTATVWPPVFDLYSLGDIRDLDSFVVTVSVKNTVNGDTTQTISTIGYMKEPYSAYTLNEYYPGNDRIYLLDGRVYSVTNTGDWYISTGNGDELFSKAEIPTGNTGKLVDAQFAAQEDYKEIPAYHFVLEQTTSTTVSGVEVVLEGDFYVALTGNYVLYSHWKETSSQGNFSQIYEVTEELTSINQLTEITIPTDMQDMVTALELPAELGLPLPADSALYSMIRYKSCCGVDTYNYSTPKTSIDEFLDYYRNLAPTNGWAVSHVGHVSLHENDCEFSRECVIINKGGTQVILYYNGASIRAQFDWPHRFGPL